MLVFACDFLVKKPISDQLKVLFGYFTLKTVYSHACIRL